MQDLPFHQITIDQINLPAAVSGNIQVSVLRLDKIDPLISGNKWFKLRYYLLDAVQKRNSSILTFGGAWSNHILATARACQLNNLHSIGIIRGEEPANYSSTLRKAREMGMELIFISREDYAAKKIPALPGRENVYAIDEGGYGLLGAKGAATIADHFPKGEYSHICCSIGTGTMMAGLRNAVSSNIELIGISVLKNNTGLGDAVSQLLTSKDDNFRIYHDYHFGGYAKYNDQLVTFMNSLYELTNIPTDFVYTGKLFFAVNDLVEKGTFPGGSKVLVIHSGGLQGNVSLRMGTLIF
jgi:1-aminocyclopropane-1-carboxylate deaminase